MASEFITNYKKVLKGMDVNDILLEANEVLNYFDLVEVAYVACKRVIAGERVEMVMHSHQEYIADKLLDVLKRALRQSRIKSYTLQDRDSVRLMKYARNIVKLTF